MSEQTMTTVPTTAPGRGRRAVLAAGVGALMAAGTVLGVSYAVTRGETVNGTGSLAQASSVLPRWNGGGYGLGGAQPSPGSGAQPYPGSGSGSGSGSGAGSGSGSSTSTSATAAQQVGVVDIDTVLGYQRGAAAGTGTVVSSNGEILTNNHVVDGATKITVTVVATGRAYAANVVGTDPTQDVAVLQLVGASGLQTANYGNSGAVAVGDSVTGVGNALGAGGTPSATTGTVAALDQSITATDEGGANAENLTGLIETDAQIQPGDSGGPLYDAAGKIVGMDTAAQTNGRQTSAGYAITINHALDVAQQIESASASSSTIHLGLPAFLGVSVADVPGIGGAGVEQVVSGGPAAQAGIVPGDVITAVGSTSIDSIAQLEPALAAHRPGQSVTITFTDTSGQSHRADVTLVSGPAD